MGEMALNTKTMIDDVMSMRLKDRVALITGSSRGIGRAAAILFAKEGANIVVNYHSSAAAAEDTVKKIEAIGRKAVAVQADVGNLKDLPKLVNAALNNFGKIDILYHNAAIHYRISSLDEVTEAVWDQTQNMLLKGPFFLTKLVVPHMMKQGKGNILFTSSTSAMLPVPGEPHYLTAKGGTNVLVKVLSGWYGPQIRVNAVIPGGVMSPMYMHHHPDMWKNLEATTSTKRLTSPLDVAKAALFLVSDEANQITGVLLPIDGGRMAATSRSGQPPSKSLPGLQRYPTKDFDYFIKKYDLDEYEFQ